MRKEKTMMGLRLKKNKVRGDVVVEVRREAQLTSPAKWGLDSPRRCLSLNVNSSVLLLLSPSIVFFFFSFFSSFPS